MEIIHPSSAQHLAERNALLQQALRPGAPIPLAIEAEYPIVLHPSSPELSHCVMVDGVIIGHANLWPRVLVDPNTNKRKAVALVGNVATAENFRGRGVMRALLNHLAEHALQRHMSALILWSDLTQFYQNLGFVSLGKEWRYLFRAADLPDRGHLRLETAVSSLSDKDLLTMMALRPGSFTTLERSVPEMRRLLGIPETHIFLDRDSDGDVSCFLVVGKGCDMGGVVHEWGCTTPEAVLGGLAWICRAAGWTDITLLTPHTLQPVWDIPFKDSAAERSEHAMAMALPLVERAIPESVFIWGLDSI